MVYACRQNRLSVTVLLGALTHRSQGKASNPKEPQLFQ